MKKLALAATVALSLSALGAGPATAAGLGTAPTDNAPTDNAPTESAPADENASDDDATPSDHALALKYTSMTPLEVTKGKGIEYTIDGLKAGDVVSTSLGDEESTVQEDGAFDGSVAMDSEPDFNTTVDFTVTVEREGKTLKEYQAEVKIIEGDRGDYDDGQLVMNGESGILAQDFTSKGLNLTMVNCGAGDEVHFAVAKEDADGEKSVVWEKKQLAGEDEAASVRYVPETLTDASGKYEVTAECGNLADSAEVTVHSDDSQG